MLYTNTVTTTWANLITTLNALTADSNIEITDPENVILDNSTTSGSLGYLLKNSYTGSYKLDFTPTDMTRAQYGTNNGLALFNGCKKLAGIGDLPSAITNGNSMFTNCSAFKKWTLTKTSNITNASSMFLNCAAMSIFDATYMTNLTNANGMFYASGLGRVDGLSSFANVINATEMFRETYLTSFDMKDYFTNVQYADGMFSYCYYLTSINVNLPNATTANSLLNSDDTLTSATGLSTMSKINSAALMFNGCTALTNVSINFPLVKNAYGMFMGCTSLSTLDLSSLVAVLQIDNIANGCTNLTKIYCGSVSSVTTYVQAFLNSSLSKVYVSTSAANTNWTTIVKTNYSTACLSAAITPTLISSVVYKRVA